MSKLKLVLLSLVPIFMLQACATAVVTGAATGATMAHDRRTTGAIIDDQGIEFKADAAIYEKKDLYNQSHINVTSYDGIVLVTGETPTQDMKDEVTNLIKAIPKVRRVHNELAIAAPSALPSRSSDAWITSKIKTKMTADEQIDPFYFKVVTERGVVYLMGMVSHAEANKAIDLVKTTSGVQRVVTIFEYTD